MYKRQTTYNLIAEPVANAYTPTALPFNTVVNVVVKAVDTSGNPSAANSNIATFTTAPLVDISPPSTMSNLRLITAFTQGAIITWDPGTDNVQSAPITATIELSPAGCAAFTTNASKVAEQILTLNLQPSTTYCVRGLWVDAAGNSSVAYSNTLQFTTASTGLPVPRLDVPFGGRSAAGTRPAAGTRLPRP